MDMGALIVVGLSISAALLVTLCREPARTCPDCGLDLPKLRQPAGWGQMLWGGWTCSRCHAVLDAQGRVCTPRGEVRA